uniref:DUF4794 domain-containing protein n=1 Tax=Glossina brevipalpis TaxID=37001 RepID=A0A1A9WLH9_9MUSC
MHLLSFVTMKHNVCVILTALLMPLIATSSLGQERDLGSIGAIFANNKQILLNHKQNILEHKQNILNIFKVTTTSTSAPNTNVSAVSPNEDQAATTDAPNISSTLTSVASSTMNPSSTANIASIGDTTPTTLANPTSSTSAPVSSGTIDPPAVSVRDNLPDYPPQPNFYPQLPFQYVLIPIAYLPYQDPPSSYHPQHYQNPLNFYPTPYQYVYRLIPK